MRAGPGNPIPDESRAAVEARDPTCPRCLGPGRDWHHRRGRSVRDEHTHCPCNGVRLCGTCHEWAHAHPEQARAVGLIVRRNVAHPGQVPMLRLDGWWILHCSGSGEALLAEQVELWGGSPRRAC